MTAPAGQLPGQLDLLAEIGRDDRIAWEDRFTRPRVHVGAATVVRGYECPSCGRREQSAEQLNTQHGYDPRRPGRTPRGGWGASCFVQDLRAAQYAAGSRHCVVTDCDATTSTGPCGPCARANAPRRSA